MKSDLHLVFQNGAQSLTFAYDWPFWIEELDGVTSSEFDVSTRALSSQDGELYLNSQATKRTITITAVCRAADAPFECQREAVLSFFQPRSEGTLYFYEGTVSRKIAYQVKSAKFETSGQFRALEVQLVCPDPVWKALEDEVVSMAQVVGDMEFPAELIGAFTVSHRNESVMATIDNNSNAARSLTITFEASGVVTNPTLIEVTRQERLQVNVTMHSGDILTVTTGAGSKRVQLTSDGVTSNANNLWVYGSTWLQAEPGRNIYRYTADSGEGSLSATIRSTPGYWGA